MAVSDAAQHRPLSDILADLVAAHAERERADAEPNTGDKSKESQHSPITYIFANISAQSGEGSEW